MSERERKRLLVVTPEITYLPEGMGNMANRLRAKAGGLADVTASLVTALDNRGVDVHVALPHYRQMFNVDVGQFISDELRIYKSKLPEERIHLAEDRIFYYRDRVYDGSPFTNLKLALAFQREVINNIIPRVRPDLIHCNDWMTGLLPAAASRQGIRSLFTVHNIHTVKATLASVEEVGIDTREFWRHCYYDRPPTRFEEVYNQVGVDMLATGIWSADAINTVSPSFLAEVVRGEHDFVTPSVRATLRHKVSGNAATGVLNAPDPSYAPEADEVIVTNYGPDDALAGKRANKLYLQEYLGLAIDGDAALAFWPSRLDPSQKGCELLTHILFQLTERYRHFQLVLVASGAYQPHFHEIVAHHDLHRRVSVCSFHEKLARLAYAASDFVLMPSRFEPCGLPQMIGARYGTLPIARATGGLKDTVAHLDVSADAGNGFVFETYDHQGLAWAIDQAMQFHSLPPEPKARQLARVMRDAAARFTHEVCAERYLAIYRQLLGIPAPA